MNHQRPLSPPSSPRATPRTPAVLLTSSSNGHIHPNGAPDHTHHPRSNHAHLQPLSLAAAGASVGPISPDFNSPRIPYRRDLGDQPSSSAVASPTSTVTSMSMSNRTSSPRLNNIYTASDSSMHDTSSPTTPTASSISHHTYPSHPPYPHPHFLQHDPPSSPSLRQQPSNASSFRQQHHQGGMSVSLKTMNSQASFGNLGNSVRRQAAMDARSPRSRHPSSSALAAAANNPPNANNGSSGTSPRSSSRSASGGQSQLGIENGKEKPNGEQEKDKDKDKEGEKENGSAFAPNAKPGEKDKDKEKGGEDGSKDKDGKDAKDQPRASSASASAPPVPVIRQKYRNTPHLPHSHVDRAPPSVMHWSRAPVHGALPTRNMRAHSVTLVDNLAWVFGGCDDKGCWRDVWCFDIETFQWTHPDMLGDLPPPCRAHTATLVDKKLYVFGGGEGPTYYNDLYILDTLTHKWHKPNIPQPLPLPRRAHTAVFYGTKIYVFGGGNGHRALNDVWALDVSVPADKLKWEQVSTQGVKPGARGYHTANLVGSVMVVLGGSDGRECFSDVWVLDLDTFIWREVRPDKTYRRLSHSSTQVGSYLFVMGGHDGNKYSHELLLFNLVTLQFEPRQTMGRPPSSRGYHVSALADSRVFVFGGFDGHTVFDDVWLLDLAAAAYLPQVTSFGIMVE